MTETSRALVMILVLVKILLLFGQECLKFLEGSPPMADAVFEFLGHFRVCFSLPLIGLEDRIPAKVGRAPGGYDFAVGSPIEHANLLTGPSGVRYDGLGVGRPVVETVKHLVQPFMAAVFQKPFYVGPDDE